MLRNYFLVALRHLYLNPLYSAINILGLTIGLACCILILTAVRYELSFDRYFSDADRIYRVGTHGKNPNTGEKAQVALSILPSAKQMAADFPDVETYTRIFTTLFSLKREDRQFNEDVHLVDSDFFSIFNFRFIKGDKSTALQAPLSAVLTESMAKKYFGAADAIGKTLSVDNKHQLKITGIIEDTPPNTHINFGIVISLNSTRTLLGEKQVEELDRWNTINNGYYGYIKSKPKTSAEAIRNKLDTFFLRNSGLPEWFPARPSLQALEGIHLNPAMLEPEPTRIGHRFVVYSAIVLAGLVLVIACINFINLTTARAGLRAREIGMRKVVGASREQLTVQYFVETLLLVLIAAILACTLAELVLPAFGNMINRDLGKVYRWDGLSISGLSSLIVLTTLSAGFYPSLILSRSPVTQILKGESYSQGKNVLRGWLTTSQFCLSVVLIIITLIAHAQFRHIRNMDLGFQKEHVLLLTAKKPGSNAQRFVGDINEKFETLRNELLRHPEIKMVAGSTWHTIQAGNQYFRQPGQAAAEEGMLLNFGMVDYDFIEVYGMKLIAGRNFSRDYTGDTIDFEKGTGVALLTRQGARKLGVNDPADSIGKTIIWGNVNLQVVGVLEDVSTAGGYADQKLDILINVSWFNVLSLKLSGKDMADVLDYVDKTWKKVIPDFALNRYFYDTSYAFFDDIFKKIIAGFTAFAVLAITIACLGLYAMSSFVAERRNREIGIRKVLGASVTDIIRLLIWDLSKPVVIAIAVAIPISILLVNRLLERFPEQVSLHIGYFLTAIGITLAIAWITVAVHTWRVANQNPATSLRYE